MSWVYNPFTGKLDQAGSGGGGGSQVNSDWNATSGVEQILNKPTLFSGAYSALTGTPSTFTPSAHASSHASGGSDALTLSSSQITGLATVATSGSYADLTSKPTLFSGAYSDLTGKPSLSTVATSGSAADLTGTLADARLSSNVVLLTGAQSITGNKSFDAGTLTASTPLSLTQTWNSSATTFKALTVNVTDTASATGSLLADFQTGGTSTFSIAKYGTTSGTGGFSFTPASNTGTWSFVSGSTSSLQFRMGSTVVLSYRGDSIGFCDLNTSFYYSIGADTRLYRDAANTLAQRNSTNPQTTRIYGTYTDVSNARWLSISNTTGGLVTLTATGNGTGASGNLLKLTQPILLPASSVTLATNGDLAFEATSNTSLTIRYRGSDGTTRSASLTLA